MGAAPACHRLWGAEPRALRLLHNFHEHEKEKKIMFSWLTDSFLLPFQRETGPYCLSSRRALHRSLQKITVLA